MFSALVHCHVGRNNFSLQDDDSMWLCPDCSSHECSACASGDPPLTLNNHIICGPDGDDDEDDEGAFSGGTGRGGKTVRKRARSRGGKKQAAGSTVLTARRAKLGCDRMFHLACVGLSGLPDGDWFCRDCHMAEPSIYTLSAERKARKARERGGERGSAGGGARGGGGAGAEEAGGVRAGLRSSNRQKGGSDRRSDQGGGRADRRRRERHGHGRRHGDRRGDRHGRSRSRNGHRRRRRRRDHSGSSSSGSSSSSSSGSSDNGPSSSPFPSSASLFSLSSSRPRGWMGLDVEDDGSSLWCPVELLDPSPTAFAAADEVPVLFRGGGELEGRFGLLPKRGDRDGSGGAGAGADGSGPGGDCRHLCHGSDKRWRWTRVRPKSSGLWHRTPTLAQRVSRSVAFRAKSLAACPGPPPLPPPCSGVDDDGAKGGRSSAGRLGGSSSSSSSGGGGRGGGGIGSSSGGFVIGGNRDEDDPRGARRLADAAADRRAARAASVDSRREAEARRRLDKLEAYCGEVRGRVLLFAAEAGASRDVCARLNPHVCSTYLFSCASALRQAKEEALDPHHLDKPTTILFLASSLCPPDSWSPTPCPCSPGTAAAASVSPRVPPLRWLRPRPGQAQPRYACQCRFFAPPSPRRLRRRQRLTRIAGRSGGRCTAGVWPPPQRPSSATTARHRAAAALDERADPDGQWQRRRRRRLPGERSTAGR